MSKTITTGFEVGGKALFITPNGVKAGPKGLVAKDGASLSPIIRSLKSGERRAFRKALRANGHAGLVVAEIKAFGQSSEALAAAA